jgi:hypothetical protein
MRRIALALVILLAGGCGTSNPPPFPSSIPNSAVTVAAADPYDTYQQLVTSWGITDAPDLTRDWALARALLGCSSTWPPKTIDAALAQAYAAQIADAKKQGHCG